MLKSLNSFFFFLRSLNSLLNLKYEKFKEILVTMIPFGVPSLPAGEHTGCGDLKGKDAAFLVVEGSPS